MPNPIRRRLGAGQMNNQVEQDPMMMDQGMGTPDMGGAMAPMPNPIRGALDEGMGGGAMPVHDPQQFQRSYGMPVPPGYRGLGNVDPTQEANPFEGRRHVEQHQAGNKMLRAGVLAAKRQQIITQKQRLEVARRQAKTESEAAGIDAASRLADQALIDLERAMGAYGGQSMPEMPLQ